jgi:ribosomal protein L21E
MSGLRRVVDALLTRVCGPQIGVYNGVAARDRSVLRRDHEPEHKAALSAAVREAVQPGDEVIVVGGGRAVAAVHAAHAGANVTVYEAGRDAYAVTKSVQALNDVAMTVRHAVVGAPGGSVGGATADETVAPESLSGDLLVLDCEGAERDILPVTGFDTVIVETHPRYDAPLPAVRDQLEHAAVVAADPIDGRVVVDRRARCD